MEADYVIVGAGTAGCTLAARLAAPGRSVIVVEEGEHATALAAAPAAPLLLPASRGALRLIESEPDPTVLGRRHRWATARGIDAPLAIDALHFAPPTAAECDAWAAAGARGWAARDVVATLAQLAAVPTAGAEALGMLRLATPGAGAPLAEAFLAACAGHGAAALAALTLADGRSDTPYRRWLEPRRRDGELRVLPGTRVTALQLDGRRCIGLYARRRGEDLQIRARAEVILAAGAFGSPQLLCVSGVGPPGLLESAGIRIRHALAGVGAHLSDHAAVRVTATGRGAGLLRRERTPLGALLRALQWRATRRGRLAVPPLLAVAALRSGPALAAPDLECLLTPAALVPGGGGVAELEADAGASLTFYSRRPRSRGRLRLSGPGIEAPLKIEHLLLSDAGEVDLLAAAVRLGRELLARAPLAALLRAPRAPAAALASAAELEHYVRSTAVPLGHASGTCRIGAADDPDAVVDPRLCVHGMDGLRIADASVLPSTPVGGTRAAAMLVAARAAAFISEAP